jgi:uncharacterized protein YbbK (DUF523 family)
MSGSRRRQESTSKRRRRRGRRRARLREVTRVVVDEDTQGYCATFESLAAAREALAAAGLPGAAVVLEDRSPSCDPIRVRK